MSETGTFLNPYNFIPFPNKKSVRYEDTDIHTGVITYTITTRSPLFIPNTSNENAFPSEIKDHKSYDFYSYTELERGKDYSNSCAVPVIPGSELRGMIRGIYETLTGSCMGVLNGELHPVKRSSEVFKAGLIRKEKGKDASFSLVGAKDCIYRESTHCNDKLFLRTDKKEGQKVFFRKQNRGKAKPLITDCSVKEDSAHPECGYLIKGMEGPKSGNKKHNCHVFIPQTDNVVEKELSKNDIERLMRVITSYQEQPTEDKEADKDSYKEYLENLEAFLRQDGDGYFPVYYSIIKEKGQKLLYLSPASITKEISNHSIGDLAGEFKPCTNKSGRCPACDLFGMAGATNEESFASRIRFADAYVAEEREPEKYYDPIVTLETLGSPKLSNTEFYLERMNGADFWTYDYYTLEGKVHPYQARLRGRKYYWHQPETEEKPPKDIEKTKLNKTVRPVKRGVTFEGKLYFNRISGRQLGQLLWILNGGKPEEQPSEGPVAYKLGGGKPLGLGSVELKVKSCSERRFAMEGGKLCYYNETDTNMEIPGYAEAGFLTECREDFLTICALNAAAGKNVTYPIVPEQRGKPMTEGFKWFGLNHAIKGNGRMPNARIQMQTLCVLPKIKGVGTLPEKPVKKSGHRQKTDTGKSNFR